MIAQRTATLAEIASGSETPEDFSFYLRDFLDGFYSAPSPGALCEEPPLTAQKFCDGGRLDACLGAVCEHLARTYLFSVPAWCRLPSRTLAEPWFAMNSDAGRLLLLAESPAAFRARNIFISENALHRA